MRAPIRIDRITADQWQTWRTLRLDALSEAPDAFGSKLADWQDAADREDRWRDRLTAVPANFVASRNSEAVGMASGTQPDQDGTVELISMWVTPAARGRRIGDRLIEAVLDWAKQQGAARVALECFESNTRAAHLYRRHGFVDTASLPSSDRPGHTERRMVRDLGL